MKKISNNGLNLLKNFEKGPNGKFADKIYQCSSDKNTIGWGHVILPTDTIKEPITLAQADELLKHDVSIAEKCVNESVLQDINQNQFDALVSLTFNIGQTSFKKSTLLKFINQELWDKVPNQFLRWVYSKGLKSEGLKNRRLAEIKLWKEKI